VVLSAGDLFRCSPLDAARLVGHTRLEALLREWGASVDSHESLDTPRCQHGTGGWELVLEPREGAEEAQLAAEREYVLVVYISSMICMRTHVSWCEDARYVATRSR
jgi:hypothetical protein